MHWLLSSPWHQQLWYWLCRIGRPFSYLGKDFSYHINVKNDININTLLFALKNLAHKGLILAIHLCLRSFISLCHMRYHFDGLVQKRRNSSALACLPCTNPSISFFCKWSAGRCFMYIYGQIYEKNHNLMCVSLPVSVSTCAIVGARVWVN